MLHHITYGERTAAPPLIIAPGLFGSARNWTVIARRLSEGRQVIALDMRNHGDSFWDDDHSYAALAGDIAGVIAANGGQADLLGHSMGGKAAMALALTQPGLIRRLVVADIAPKAYSHSHIGLIEAMRAMKLDDLGSRSQADARLAGRVKDPGTRAFLLQSLDLRDGPVRWKFNLDALAAGMQGLVGWPDDLPGAQPFAGPALFLSGKRSDYVTDADRPAIRALFPAAQFSELDGAGHWLHAERPREVETEVAHFLA